MVSLGCCFMNHADELLRFHVGKHITVGYVDKRAAYALATVSAEIPNVTSLLLRINAEP